MDPITRWFYIGAGFAGLLIILFVKLGDRKMERMKAETDLEVAELLAIAARTAAALDRHRVESPETYERGQAWYREVQREARLRRREERKHPTSKQVKGGQFRDPNKEGK